ncbi:MAG: hypothetical protein KF819_27715 [Labilithrix sp.]|nr:hypothetical protein [Labilithrix sp.]
MRLDDVPRELLAVLAALALAHAAFTWLRRVYRRASMRRRFARASEGEREAAALLVEQGFAIEAAQARITYELALDGSPVTIPLRADYIVSRKGMRFVAEVKTGRLAPRIETAATRRQLFEYHHAFGVDGVLLVDADARRVHVVELRRPAARRPFGLFIFAAVAVALVVFLAR